MKNLNDYNFTRPISFISNRRNFTDNTQYNDDESIDYIELITNLTLVIGSNEIERFSCSAHKTNLAVKKEIYHCQVIYHDVYVELVLFLK